MRQLGCVLGLGKRQFYARLCPLWIVRVHNGALLQRPGSKKDRSVARAHIQDYGCELISFSPPVDESAVSGSMTLISFTVPREDKATRITESTGPFRSCSVSRVIKNN